MADSTSDNDDFVVIERDPNALDIPCIFCGRTKRSNPEMEFATDGRAAICAEDVDRAMFTISNANRRTLGQL